jgi:hypothetical protein
MMPDTFRRRSILADVRWRRSSVDVHLAARPIEAACRVMDGALGQPLMQVDDQLRRVQTLSCAETSPARILTRRLWAAQQNPIVLMRPVIPGRDQMRHVKVIPAPGAVNDGTRPIGIGKARFVAPGDISFCPVGGDAVSGDRAAAIRVIPGAHQVDSEHRLGNRSTRRQAGEVESDQAANDSATGIKGKGIIVTRPHICRATSLIGWMTFQHAGIGDGE